MSDYNKNIARAERLNELVEKVEDLLVAGHYDDQDAVSLVQVLLFRIVKLSRKPLIDLLYAKGATQKEIGDALGVTDAAISLNYPKGAK